MNTDDENLQLWARRKMIWKTDSWNEYLQQLLEVYTQAKTFKDFHTWLIENFNDKSINTFIDEDLKDSLRMCLSGGGLEENAFGRLMFEKFGFGVKYCDTYQDSLEEYSQKGDNVQIYVDNIILGLKTYDEFLNLLKEVVEHFSNVLNMKFEEPKVEEDFTKWIKPRDPKPLLIEKIERFLNTLAKMYVFANYYTLFVMYFDTTPLVLLKLFLNCDVEGLKNLAKLFRIKYIHNNLEIVELDNINNSNLYELFWISHYSPKPPSIVSCILRLFEHNGFAQNIIENFVDISDQISGFWLNTVEMLKDLMKNGNWLLNDVLRDFLIIAGESKLKGVETSICAEVSNAKVVVIRLLKFKREWNEWLKMYPSDIIGLSKRLETIAQKYRYKLELEYEFRKTVTPSKLMEQLFPLLSTGFLYVSKWDTRNKTIQFKFAKVPHLYKLLEEVLYECREKQN